MQKKILVGSIVALAMMPALAFAQTSDTQGQIQTLLQQIQMLQKQLKTLLASSTQNMGEHHGWIVSSTTNSGMPFGQIGKAVCVSLNRNIKIGDSGDDVRSIQEMLKNNGDLGFSGNVTGFFGQLTAKAMMRFQQMNGIASSTDGSIGPKTRGFFERHCGNGLDDKQGKMPGNGKMNITWVTGSISANNASNISVDNGSTIVTIYVSTSTSVKIFAGTSTPPTIGTMSDLAVGKKVRASGQKNSDGSINAMMIDVGDTLPPMPMMKDMMDDHGEMQGDMRPQGMMPTLNGPQHGPGMNGGPQNW